MRFKGAEYVAFYCHFLDVRGFVMRTGLTLAFSIISAPLFAFLWIVTFFVIIYFSEQTAVLDSSSRLIPTLSEFFSSLFTSVLYAAMMTMSIRSIGGKSYPRMGIILPVLAVCSLCFMFLLVFFLPMVINGLQRGSSEDVEIGIRVVLGMSIGFCIVFPMTKRFSYETSQAPQPPPFARRVADQCG